MNRFLISLLSFFLSSSVFAAVTQVHVSILPEKFLVEKIAKEKVSVKVVVPPGASPATYEPTIKQMASMSSSRLYFAIGIPFERVWLKRLLTNSPKMKLVDLHKKLDLDIHEDPHYWTSPKNVKKMAAVVKDAFIALNPKDAKFYDKNYKDFLVELDLLDKEIRKTLRNLSYRSFMVFHPAWGYFAKEYGLRQLAIEKHGKGPSPKSMENIIKQGIKEKQKIIIVQKQFDRKLAASVAKRIGAEVVIADPLSEDYIQNLKSFALLLQRYLGFEK